MPLRTKEDKNKKNSVDYKARLEKKLYLARETPEPVFDLSDCNLKSIPNNIFSLCKVFRKEALYLQNNLLSSLSSGGPLQDLKCIKYIDISKNKFSKLPAEINELEKLEVLDVSNNQLTQLPEEIGCLENLMLLNVSHNRLTSLPSSLGNCKKMEVLNLANNEPLRKLPATLGRLGSLVILEVDSTVTYPSQEICNKGVDAMLKFFQGELNEDVEIPSTSEKSEKSQKVILLSNYDNLQEQIKLLEKLKEETQKERLNFEKQMLDSNKKEIQLQQQLKDQKSKLLEDVKNQQQSLDAELAKLQAKKNNERALLIQLVSKDERKSNEVVNKILTLNKNIRTQISNKWDNERKQEEQILLTHTKTKAVEKQMILVSMEEMMKEEIQRAQTINEDRRLHVVQSLASEVSQQNQLLENLVKKYNENQTHLIETLKLNEEVQKSAVASLLEKSDSATWELKQQVAIVERQLAELTRLELSKRKLESDCQITELAKNRMALTEMLVILLEQQQERRRHLIETIRKMEMMRESVADSEAFWMQQYDKLLKSKCHEMVTFLESCPPVLVNELFIHGVFHYLPLLKDVCLSEHELEKLNANSLSKLGIKNAEDRDKILRAVEAFLKSKRPQQNVPSAPTFEEPTAPSLDNLKSASYLVPEECVICLERKPNIIFVPCGHICCCYKCFTSITLCPLCRTSISKSHKMPTTD